MHQSWPGLLCACKQGRSQIQWTSCGPKHSEIFIWYKAGNTFAPKTDESNQKVDHAYIMQLISLENTSRCIPVVIRYWVHPRRYCYNLSFCCTTMSYTQLTFWSYHTLPIKLDCDSLWLLICLPIFISFSFYDLLLLITKWTIFWYKYHSNSLSLFLLSNSNR